MKKVLLSVLILSSFGCAVYAADFNTFKQKAMSIAGEQLGVSVSTNLKQLEAEKKATANKLTPEYRLFTQIGLIREDKTLYDLDNEAETLYGKVISILNENKTLAIPNTTYGNLVKQRLDKIAGYEPDNLPTTKEFESLKITVPDSDWDKLDPLLQGVIVNLINTY